MKCGRLELVIGWIGKGMDEGSNLSAHLENGNLLCVVVR